MLGLSGRPKKAFIDVLGKCTALMLADMKMTCTQMTTATMVLAGTIWLCEPSHTPVS